jgi:hypothetical protein
MNTIISKDEVTDMLENAQFIIPSQTIKDLRDIWSESMKVQEEIGGIFCTKTIVTTEKYKTIALFVDVNSKAQSESVISHDKVPKNGYTVCYVNDDVPFTYHTHPVECDDNGWPQNYPNLISNEDMIGVVQDHVANTGYLSNINGRLLFDVLCCPMGIFIYSSQRKIINKWVDTEDKLDVDESKRVIKKIDRKTKFSKEDVDDEIIAKAKELISSTHEDKNPYWASVENSLMNAGFNEYIGSWYWTKNKKGFFSQQILKDFSTLGYEFWFNKKSAKEISETKTAHDRANATIDDQIRWFNSKEFLRIDWNLQSNQLRKYIEKMSSIGYFVKFFHWSVTEIKFKLEL